MSRANGAGLRPEQVEAAYAARRTARAGWSLIGLAVVLVGYIAVAVTIGAEFERDLEEAADRQEVAVNAVAAATQAQIAHDHPLYVVITSLLLLVPPLLLLIAVNAIKQHGRWNAAGSARMSAGASAIGWWAYVAIGLGLLAGDPQDLPPVVENFESLTVPVVTTLSLLALASVALAGEAVHTVGSARRAGRITVVVCALMGIVSLIGLITSRLADPIPPLVIVPGALILGVALVRVTRRLE